MKGSFQTWQGTWSGVKRLWLTPEADEIKTNAEAKIGTIGKGKFLQIEYGWQMDGESQEGLVILPATLGEEEAHSVWLDSWHTRQDMMVCEVASAAGKVTMMGTYQAPSDEHWGWRLEFSQADDESLSIQMFNISPECDECLAVEMELARTTQA
jgi:hypothetical protein